MKLIPFFRITKTLTHFTVETLFVFLAYAGKSIWTSEESGILTEEYIRKEYCEPNGFVVNKILIEKDIAYIEVNPEKMNLDDFYSWDEALGKPGKPECWRRFFFFQDSKGNEWWSPKGLIEAEIQGYGNIEQLQRHLRTYF